MSDGTGVIKIVIPLKWDELMAKFHREHLGISEDSLEQSFKTDTDWTLIVKLHAFVESSLNYLIVHHFCDYRLEEFVSKLDVSDRARGKMAIIKALDLLPAEYRSFIQKLSEIRNKLAHGVKNVDFDLKRHLADLDIRKLKELSDAIVPIATAIIDPIPDEQLRAYIKKEPRHILFLCVTAVIRKVYEKEAIEDYINHRAREVASQSNSNLE